MIVYVCIKVVVAAGRGSFSSHRQVIVQRQCRLYPAYKQIKIREYHCGNFVFRNGETPS